MHATTGALGQGLSIAIGHAIACKLKKLDNSIFCVIGDGETQEGQIWEALMLAPKYELDNLICFIDANGAQNDGYVKDILDLGDLQSKIKSFGWQTYSIDGHNLEELSVTMNSLEKNRKPICIILNTIKGKGVSFMGSPAWHAKVPSKEEYLNALSELNDESNS